MAHSTCPVWLGHFLASPLRKLFQDPERILGPHIRPGMTVLDVGSAMGFFSLPMARMVGASGQVVCVDLQPRMLAGLEKRARRAGLIDRLRPRLCTEDSLGLADLDGGIDFALTFAMVHETSNPAKLFAEIVSALKPGGSLLLAEPRGHVDEEAFAETIALARKNGLHQAEPLSIRQSRAALLRRA